MSWDKLTIQLVEGHNLYFEYNGHKIKVCGIQKGGGIRIMPIGGGPATIHMFVERSQ